MKKLTLIVPIYKTEKYIRENIDMWTEASNKFDVHFIQDSLEGEVKELAIKSGATFHSKENGNWGSVINYAKNEINIKTKYVKIVDADDKIYVNGLIKIINESNGEDLLIGNVRLIRKNKSEIHKYNDYKKSIPFIHGLIMKTKVFKSIDDIIENYSYMDSLVKVYLYEKSKTIYNGDVLIYDYFLDLPGQSMDPTKKIENKFIKATQIISDVLLDNLPVKAASISDVLSRLEDVIWYIKDNEKYKNAYRKLWKVSIRGFHTNYIFILIASIFKKKVY